MRIKKKRFWHAWQYSVLKTGLYVVLNTSMIWVLRKSYRQKIQSCFDYPFFFTSSHSLLLFFLHFYPFHFHEWYLVFNDPVNNPSRLGVNQLMFTHYAMFLQKNTELYDRIMKHTSFCRLSAKGGSGMFRSLILKSHITFNSFASQLYF